LVNLLEDFYAMFERYGARVRSQQAVDHLNNLEDRPWSEISNGRSLTPAKLARMLKELDITPRPTVFPGYPDGTRGYLKEDFEYAFSRYLPEQPARPQGDFMENANVLNLHPCVLSEGHLGNTIKRQCYEHKVTVQVILQGMSRAEAERFSTGTMTDDELEDIVYRIAEREAIRQESRDV